VRYVWLALAFLMSLPLAAQEPAKKKPTAKKQAAAKKTAHQKPTPEQIRKFNELQKSR
jgi:hypothetical protein